MAAQVLDAALRLTTAPDSDGVADAPESGGVNGAEVGGHGGASLKSMAARAALAASRGSSAPSAAWLDAAATALARCAAAQAADG